MGSRPLFHPPVPPCPLSALPWCSGSFSRSSAPVVPPSVLLPVAFPFWGQERRGGRSRRITGNIWCVVITHQIFCYGPPRTTGVRPTPIRPVRYRTRSNMVGPCWADGPWPIGAFRYRRKPGPSSGSHGKLTTRNIDLNIMLRSIFVFGPSLVQPNHGPLWDFGTDIGRAAPVGPLHRGVPIPMSGSLPVHGRSDVGPSGAFIVAFPFWGQERRGGRSRRITGNIWCDIMSHQIFRWPIPISAGSHRQRTPAGVESSRREISTAT